MSSTKTVKALIALVAVAAPLPLAAVECEDVFRSLTVAEARTETSSVRLDRDVGSAGDGGKSGRAGTSSGPNRDGPAQADAKESTPRAAPLCSTSEPSVVCTSDQPTPSTGADGAAPNAD